MLQERLLDVTDGAYQAALDPGLWPDVLETLADTLGGSSAALLWRRVPEWPTGGVAFRQDQAAIDLYFRYYERINPVQIGYEKLGPVRCGHSMVVTDTVCVPRDELVRSEHYNDFRRVYDLEHALMIGGDGVAGGGGSAFNIFRTRREGAFDDEHVRMAQALHRSLNRAFAVSRRIGAERRLRETLADFIDRLAGAVLIVGRDGRVVFANQAAEAMLSMRDGLAACEGGLRAATPDASRRLARLLGGATGQPAGACSGGAIALPRPSGRRPLALTVTPTRGDGPQDGEPLALVSVVDPDAGAVPPEERLRAFFGLTPAEARVAAALAAGFDPKEIADRLQLSINTVRLQVARVREKTDTRRQGEFISLVMRTLGVGWLAG